MIVSLPGGRFAWLVGPDEARGSLGLWPGRPRGMVEADIGLAVQQIQAELAADRWQAMRCVERTGAGVRRAFVWLDALGRERAREWLDDTPAGTAADWPKTPKPTTAADRQARAA